MMPSLPTRLEGVPLAVETRDLSKRYGSVQALERVDLQVPEGSVYVLIGPNGAGKSTLLRILLDLSRASSGNARVLGLDTRVAGPRLRAQVGYVPEASDWAYPWMRVGRLLEHHATYFPSWDRGYAERLLRALDVQPERHLGRLSKGQARRVHLVLAMAHRPAVMLLDEPTDGLDPVMRDELLGLLVEHLAETPTTMMISTHLVHEMERLADHIGVIRAGTLGAQMPVEALRRGLRRYRAEVPEGWSGSALNGSVVRRAGGEREILWTVWGKEPEVVSSLVRSGATVRETAPLTLEDAAVALLGRKETSR